MTRAAQWRCATCGEESPSWAAAERHADKAGHHRIERLLGRYWPTEKAVNLLRPEGGNS